MENINNLLSELEVAVSSTMDLNELNVADIKEEIVKLREFIHDRIELQKESTKDDDDDSDKEAQAEIDRANDHDNRLEPVANKNTY